LFSSKESKNVLFALKLIALVNSNIYLELYFANFLLASPPILALNIPTPPIPDNDPVLFIPTELGA
jgi:hypothetical protein